MPGIPSVDVAFIKQFGAEVKEAYQRKGSKLRGSVRSRTDVRGSSTIFQLAGKGAASMKARNAKVPVMNVGHSNVECFLADYYAGDWVDKLDELKTNIDERGVVANAGAYALGRKTDDLIVAALAAVGSGQNVPNGTGNLGDAAGWTKEKVQKACELLNNADVPDDGERYGLLSPQGWTNALNITEFANSQYIGEANLPYAGAPMEMRSWLGVKWMRYNGLPALVSNVRDSFIYHKTAVGFASALEIVSDVTWHGDMAAHFINHMMSQGAVVIDPTGVVRIHSTEV